VPSSDSALPRPGDDWRWCPRCRTPLARAVRGGHPRPTCEGCGLLFFANPGVGAATVVRDAAGRVLLVRRGRGYWGAGLWCIPCGFVEWGEDIRAAARREAAEEAGVEVVVGEVLQAASNFHEPERPTIGVWFAATLADPAEQPVAGDDADAVGWFDPAAPPPLAFPTDATLLARLARGPGQRRRATSSTSAPTVAASSGVRTRPKRGARPR
jgi:ADP-ribose pyrophosphatase YjhB (NUDIX family)